jgi:hypothetical protein
MLPDDPVLGVWITRFRAPRHKTWRTLDVSLGRAQQKRLAPEGAACRVMQSRLTLPPGTC